MGLEMANAPILEEFMDRAQVRAEIDAAEQNGGVGWMLWNFGNTYTDAALKRP